MVTASIDLPRATPFVQTWLDRATEPFDLYVVSQGEIQRGWFVPLGTHPKGHRLYSCAVQEILGVVPAFAKGVAAALESGAAIIACLHDDVEIEQLAWDVLVLNYFQDHPEMGLCGFGGATGLGAGDIYQTPYDPMQLARQDFRSNMRHAEAHGSRTHVPVRVACLDGFSQIGRRDFWLGWPPQPAKRGGHVGLPDNLFQRMQDWGLIHHAYDAALGCFATRLGWAVGLLPLACHHHGGLSAVADPRYHQWADAQKGTFEGTGDQKFWTDAHKIVYENFKDVLPIRT